MGKKLFLILVFLFQGANSQVLSKDPNSPSFKLTGDSRIVSNFVHRGVSQTNNDPGMQTALWFNFGPQFRMGLWGSNVSYPGQDTHLWVALNADIRIPFSDQVGLRFKYSDNKYYASNSRNGNTFGAHLDIYGYKSIFEMDSNWEGTQAGANYFAFGKLYHVFGDWLWDNQIGYSMLKTSNLSNYFDIKTAFGNVKNNFEYFVSATWTSNPSQFSGRGDLFLIFSVGAGF